jgi:DNA modification methylase
MYLPLGEMIYGEFNMQKINTKSTTSLKDLSYPMQLKLFDNVQFIYELALAELEMGALGIEFKVADNLRVFDCKSSGETNYLKNRLAYFEEVDGKITDYARIVSYNRTRSPNQYLTHWVYPYKGKYHPQMIRALLNVIEAKKGDLILDPFIGSGTTSLECQLLGIDCLGIDVSQVCVLVTKVKTESMEVIEDIEELKDSMVEEHHEITLHSFDEGKVSKQGGLGKVIDSIKNEKVRNFYKVAELIAHSDRSRRRKKDFYRSFRENMEKMLSSTKDFKKMVEELNLPLGNVETKIGDARNLKMKNESVDGIITSPPYSIALDYVKNDAHALEALGYDLERVREDFIGVRGTGKKKIELYNKDMEESYDEMYRVLKDGRYCVIVIGNATLQGNEVRTVDKTIEYCQKIGFKLEKNMDKIIFGLYNVIQKENILIFSKGK